MLKKVFFMLMGVAIALAIGLLQMSPASATVNPAANTAVYTWGYASLTSHVRVCKQINVQPRNRPMPRNADKQPIQLKSQIVSDRYCQKA
jgi:hypothetical protein